jgi:hypothetical protein
VSVFRLVCSTAEKKRLIALLPYDKRPTVHGLPRQSIQHSAWQAQAETQSSFLLLPERYQYRSVYRSYRRTSESGGGSRIGLRRVYHWSSARSQEPLQEKMRDGRFGLRIRDHVDHLDRRSRQSNKGIRSILKQLFSTNSLTHAVRQFERHNPGPAIDWTDSRAGPQLAFRLALGLADGSLRNLTRKPLEADTTRQSDLSMSILLVWTIGTLSNDPSTGARYSSIWLSTLGGGAAFFHILDGYEVSRLSYSPE